MPVCPSSQTAANYGQHEQRREDFAFRRGAGRRPRRRRRARISRSIHVTAAFSAAGTSSVTTKRTTCSSISGSRRHSRGRGILQRADPGGGRLRPSAETFREPPHREHGRRPRSGGAFVSAGGKESRALRADAACASMLTGLLEMIATEPRMRLSRRTARGIHGRRPTVRSSRYRSIDSGEQIARDQLAAKMSL